MHVLIIVTLKKNKKNHQIKTIKVPKVIAVKNVRNGFLGIRLSPRRLFVQYIMYENYFTQ